MSEHSEMVMAAVLGVIKDMEGCDTTAEADQHLNELKGYIRAITDLGFVLPDTRSDLVSKAETARRQWFSTKKCIDRSDDFRLLENFMSALSAAATEEDMYECILGAGLLAGSLHEDGAVSIAEEEVLRTRISTAAQNAGKRFGIENPLQKLNEQEPRCTVVTAREMIGILSTLPGEHLDLPLAHENGLNYFDCSRVPELTTRDSRTHQWSEQNDPEQVIVI